MNYYQMIDGTLYNSKIKLKVKDFTFLLPILYVLLRHAHPSVVRFLWVVYCDLKCGALNFIQCTVLRLYTFIRLDIWFLLILSYFHSIFIRLGCWFFGFTNLINWILSDLLANITALKFLKLKFILSFIRLIICF